MIAGSGVSMSLRCGVWLPLITHNIGNSGFAFLYIGLWLRYQILMFIQVYSFEVSKSLFLFVTALYSYGGTGGFSMNGVGSSRTFVSLVLMVFGPLSGDTGVFFGVGSHPAMLWGDVWVVVV